MKYYVNKEKALLIAPALEALSYACPHTRVFKFTVRHRTLNTSAGYWLRGGLVGQIGFKLSVPAHRVS